MSAWMVVVAVGLGSYLFRVSMLLVAARRGLPPAIERAARHAVPVSFAALAAGALATHLRPDAASVAPAAAVVAAVVAVRRTGSAHVALLAGMPTLWLVTALGAG